MNEIMPANRGACKAMNSTISFFVHALCCLGGAPRANFIFSPETIGVIAGTFLSDSLALLKILRAKKHDQDFVYSRCPECSKHVAGFYMGLSETGR